MEDFENNLMFVDDEDDSEIERQDKEELEQFLYAQVHYSSKLTEENANNGNSESRFPEFVQPQVASVVPSKDNEPVNSNLQEHSKQWDINDTDLGLKSKQERYYTGESLPNIYCYNCDEKGHTGKECNKEKKIPTCYLCGIRGHDRRFCPNDICYNCEELGHISKDCEKEKRKPIFKRYCNRCRFQGHTKTECTEIWRQYHCTVVDNGTIMKPRNPKDQNKNRFCYNCASKSHFGEDCTEQRFSNHPVYSQFVICYDKCSRKRGNGKEYGTNAIKNIQKNKGEQKPDKEKTAGSKGEKSKRKVINETKIGKSENEEKSISQKKKKGDENVTKTKNGKSVNKQKNNKESNMMSKDKSCKVTDSDENLSIEPASYSSQDVPEENTPSGIISKKINPFNMSDRAKKILKNLWVSDDDVGHRYPSLHGKKNTMNSHHGDDEESVEKTTTIVNKREKKTKAEHLESSKKNDSKTNKVKTNEQIEDDRNCDTKKMIINNEARDDSSTRKITIKSMFEKGSKSTSSKANKEERFSVKNDLLIKLKTSKSTKRKLTVETNENQKKIVKFTDEKGNDETAISNSKEQASLSDKNVSNTTITTENSQSNMNKHKDAQIYIKDLRKRKNIRIDTENLNQTADLNTSKNTKDSQTNHKETTKQKKTDSDLELNLEKLRILRTILDDSDDSDIYHQNSDNFVKTPCPEPDVTITLSSDDDDCDIISENLDGAHKQIDHFSEQNNRKNGIVPQDKAGPETFARNSLTPLNNAEENAPILNKPLDITCYDPRKIYQEHLQVYNIVKPTRTFPIQQQQQQHNRFKYQKKQQQLHTQHFSKSNTSAASSKYKNFKDHELSLRLTRDQRQKVQEAVDFKERSLGICKKPVSEYKKQKKKFRKELKAFRRAQCEIILMEMESSMSNVKRNNLKLQKEKERQFIRKQNKKKRKLRRQQLQSQPIISRIKTRSQSNASKNKKREKE